VIAKFVPLIVTEAFVHPEQCHPEIGKSEFPIATTTMQTTPTVRRTRMRELADVFVAEVSDD
jgi:hypothetical protein